MWKKLNFLMMAPLLPYALYLFFHEHKHGENVPYPYKNIRSHKFPWADGDTPLFDRKVCRVQNACLVLFLSLKNFCAVVQRCSTPAVILIVCLHPSAIA